MQLASPLWSNEDGVTTVEYAMVAVAIAVAAVVAWAAIGSWVSASVQDAANGLG